MKCNALKAYKGDVTIPVYGTIADTEVYLKKDVDAVITELKAKLDKVTAERDGNQVCIDALKAKLEDAKATAYAESVAAGIRERRLKRALYKACANWAKAKDATDPIGWNKESLSGYKWYKMMKQCLQKAEEYE